MSTLPVLPPELRAIRDAVIESTMTNTPLPPEFECLHEWLQSDGWDALQDAWINEEIALNLSSLELSDTALRSSRDNEEFDPNDDITDVMRIKFARIQVNRGFSDEDYFHNPGVHSFKIEREDGSEAWRDGPA